MKQAYLSLPLIFAATITSAQDAEVYSANDAIEIFQSLDMNPEYLRGAFLGACTLQDTYPIWNHARENEIENPGYIDINGLNIACPSSQARSQTRATYEISMARCIDPSIIQTYNCGVNFDRMQGVTDVEQLQHSFLAQIEDGYEASLPLKITMIEQGAIDWSFPHAE